MQVKDIMTSNPACCVPETSLKEVSKMMIDNDCGCIPVVENHNSLKPVGTVTDRDITIRTVAAGKNPLDLTAADVMTTNVRAVQPDINIKECGKVMKENNIRRVLVIDNTGKCCGIVAQADIAGYGSNPNFVGNVVQDISESDHTAIKTSGDSDFYQKSSETKNSFFGLNSLIPLGIGIAAGAAYKYFTSSETKSAAESLEKYGEANVLQQSSVETAQPQLKNTEPATEMAKAKNPESFKMNDSNNQTASKPDSHDQARSAASR